MSATSALLRGRAAALALMTDAVAVTRLNPAGSTTDGETGVITAAYTTVYSGAAKVQSRQVVARQANVGEAERWITHREVHLPVTATGVQADDIVTVTASVLDPDLVGKVFHVRDVLDKSYATARRLGVVEVDS